jgi:hypothetical protein
MTATARFLKLLIRLSGVGALLLGVAIWAGYALSWLTVHIAFGVVLVAAMWATAVLAFRAATHRGLSMLVFLWGIGVVAFGRAQVTILPGPTHWMVSLAHLVAGAIAMGLGVALAAGVERATSAHGGLPAAGAMRPGGRRERDPSQ